MAPTAFGSFDIQAPESGHCQHACYDPPLKRALSGPPSVWAPARAPPFTAPPPSWSTLAYNGALVPLSQVNGAEPRRAGVGWGAVGPQGAAQGVQAGRPRLRGTSSVPGIKRGPRGDRENEMWFPASDITVEWGTDHCNNKRRAPGGNQSIEEGHVICDPGFPLQEGFLEEVAPALSLFLFFFFKFMYLFLAALGLCCCI